MRKILGALSSLLFLSGSALAADIETPASYDWSGFYLGVHAGAAMVDGDVPADTPATVGFETWNGSDGLGFLGGAQVGFNHQMDNLVLGLEGKFSLAALDGDAQFAGRPDMSYDLNWLASVGPRLGFASDNTLFFGKAGIAFADFDYSHLSGGGPRAVSHTDTGFMAGVGVEHAFTENVSGVVQYEYNFFGDDVVNMSAAPLIDVKHNRDVQVFSVGLNYRF